MSDLVAAAVAKIRAAAPDFNPGVGVVLGSGLGDFVNAVTPVATLPYGVLPGFPVPGVGSHAGQLMLGQVGGSNIALLQGRAHYYERGRADEMTVAIRTLKALGCDRLVLTNAAGSLRAEMPPGAIMLITDHINFTGVSPLFGETGNQRFVDLVDAYDPALLRNLERTAERAGIVLHRGVYIWFCGPNFETPAEIRAARVLGADAVGMSTVPEVILARHAGLRVAALSMITNAAAGMSTVPLNHEQTMAVAGRAVGDVTRLLCGFLAAEAAAEPA